MKTRLLLLLLLLVGCGDPIPTTRQIPTEPSKQEQLVAKVELYKSLQVPINDSGWVFDGCDGLLFNSLISVAGVPGIDIEAAQDILDQWFRTPDHDCYEKGRTSSTISRDMFLGLLWWVWENKRLDIAQNLWRQGQVNSWSYGEGKDDLGIDRHVLTPQLIATLALLVEALGGEDAGWVKLMPAYWDEDATGYRIHLTMLHILLRVEMFSWVTPEDLSVVKLIAARYPFNPLYQFVLHKLTDGNQAAVIELLLDEKVWPAGSLPTEENFCTSWPMQREKLRWVPCPLEKHSWTGGGFLFVSWLVLKGE